MTLLAVGVCFCLWVMVARPLPSVSALGPATPTPESALVLGPRPSPRTVAYTAPLTLSVADEVRARKGYQQACAPCHAAGSPRDLLKTSTYRHGSDDQSVFQSIKQGIPGTAMGRTGMTDRDVWAIVAYLRASRS